MPRVELVDYADQLLHLEPNELGDNRILVATNLPRIHGVFKSASRSSAGTTTITSPELNEAIVLTDLIVATDKVNGATITVQFTDGTNTVVIFSGAATDAPINISTSLAGRWAGWKDARLDMVTVGNLDATVAVGYYKTPDSLEYAVWDARR